jgi:hypothetical protein
LRGHKDGFNHEGLEGHSAANAATKPMTGGAPLAALCPKDAVTKSNPI